MPRIPSKYVSDTEHIESWCWDLNSELDPNKLGTGSKKNAFWICPKHSEPYSLRVNHKTNGIGCTYCSGKSVLPGYNSLADTNPELVPLLLNSDDAFKVTSGSSKIVRVACSNHFYDISVKGLVRGKRCRFCSGNEVLVGFNDFGTLEPELSKELTDPSLALKYTKNSSKEVEWVCFKGHKWETSFKKRSGRGDGCPKCSLNISGPELKLISILESKYELVSQYRISGQKFIPDIYIPELNLIVEYDGSWYHKNKYETDKENSMILLELGYKVLRIREQDPKNSLKTLNIIHPSYREEFLTYLPKSEHIKQEWLESVLQ